MHGEDKVLYKILEDWEGWDQLGDLGVDRKILLKYD
jgi:hypothetical protein